MQFDRFTIKILEILQKDATRSISDISRAVGLSRTPCWRRIQLLEQSGVIARQVALLDAKKVNAAVNVFVAIRTHSHSREWLDNFARTVEKLPEVVEFYRMSGDIDYLLRVMVPSIEAYDQFYKKLIKQVDLVDVSSSFAMEQIKSTTALPLHYLSVTNTPETPEEDR